MCLALRGGGVTGLAYGIFGSGYRYLRGEFSRGAFFPLVMLVWGLRTSSTAGWLVIYGLVIYELFMVLGRRWM